MITRQIYYTFIPNILKSFYNYIELFFKIMLNEESEEGEMHSKFNERISQCSTNAEHYPQYEESFFIGKQENSYNLVKIKITKDEITYKHKKIQKIIKLSLTVLEQSIYLRDQKTVFALKLSHNQQTTIFSTFVKDNFINLYLILASKCILTGFEKHYRVGKSLGTGTFGKVYDGYNLFSNQNVALKVMSKQEIKKIPNGIEIVFNEIKILEKLRNYRISPLISTYETTDCFILVLEKGAGGNLLEYLRSQPHQYNKKNLKCIFKQILQNVFLLHEAGFIHRDLKPENIICKDSAVPSIFLCDFGISIQKCKINWNSQDRDIAGTIGYLSPEIINEESYNEKCDIFSVGALFFYLFTGKRLFDTKNYYQVKLLVEDSHYIDRRIQELNFMGYEIKDLLQNMLKFNPYERLSAKEALRHPYFKESECFIPNLGQIDETLRNYIQSKISRSWC